MYDFFLFNALEALFWLSLAFVCSFVMLHGVPHRYRFLGVNTTLTLFFFGISDYLENIMGGFGYNNAWLFLMKIFCVISLILSIIWYVQLRMRSE